MKYDIQILVPIVPERLEGFQKYGIYNTGNKKVLLQCLIGTQDKKIYEKGWPENIDVEIINNQDDNAIIQIYTFLSKMSADDVEADWFAKIDDDTFNDINNLINNFNKIYDPEKEFYIVPQIRHEMESCEIEILKKIGCWSSINEKFTHELEACWFSKKAITNILKNEKCIELFKERCKIKKGYTDQCMGAAARICRIHPIEDYNCSVDEHEFFKCSLWKGDLFHFHPICKEKNKINYEFIIKVLDKTEPSEEIKKILDKEFLLIVKNENNCVINSIPLYFDKNNILKSPSPDFCFYCVMKSDLILCRKDYYIQYYIFKNFNLKNGTSPSEPEFNFELYPYVK